MINSLAFLPLTDVHAGMDVLKRTLPSAAKPSIEYFDEMLCQWIHAFDGCWCPAFPSPVFTGSVERTRRHTDKWQPNQQLRGGVEPALFSAGRAPASDHMAFDWDATSGCSWSPYNDHAPSPRKPWPQTTATCDTAAPTKSLCVMSGISRQKEYHWRLSIRRRSADSVTTLTWVNSIYFSLPATATVITFMWTNCITRGEFVRTLSQLSVSLA